MGRLAKSMDVLQRQLLAHTSHGTMITAGQRPGCALGALPLFCS